MWKRPFLLLLLLPLFVLPLRALLTNGATLLAGSLPPDWFYESSQSSADLGYAVSSAGDLNGDGYADIAVGAVKYAINGSNKGGAIFVFYGGPGGLGSQPDWVFGWETSGAELGAAIAGVGDVNGDGYDDLVAGAPGCSNPQPKEGCVLVFYGAVAGLGSTPDQLLELNQRDAYLGTAVDGAGDVNGDGYADVIVGAKWFANELPNEGAAFLFLGGADGLSSAPIWQVEGNQAGASLGTAVAGAGDVNGDGFDDLLVGAPFRDGTLSDSGYAALYLGAARGPATTPAWELSGSSANERLGAAVARAGDVNGDGLADFLVGAPGYQNQAGKAVGAAFLFAGKTSGWDATSPLWTAVADRENSQFGAAVSCAGDMNGDGLGDIAIGAPMYTQDQAREGVVFIYLGTAVAPGAQPHWIAEGNKADTLFGFAVALAGDINQNGYTDLLVGAPEYRSQTELRGRAFLFYGREANAPLYVTYLPFITQ